MSTLDAKQRNRIPSKKFAEPGKRGYPIEDKAHARNAKVRAAQAAKAGRMSRTEQASIDKKADDVLRKDYSGPVPRPSCVQVPRRANDLSPRPPAELNRHPIMRYRILKASDGRGA